MRKVLIATAMLCIIGLTTSCHKKDSLVINTSQPAELRNEADSLSWAMGFTLAQNIAKTGIEPNREILVQALIATLDQKQQPMTQEQTYQLLNKLELLAYTNQSKNQQAKLEEARNQEQAYFSDLLKKNPNIKKSDKGYYYEVLKEGNGRKGEPGLVALFDYKGSFTNGQIFDQTFGNCDTVRHVINESIMPGLFDGLCNMKAGSSYRFYFPCEMAFGAKGTDNIPPYSTVIYQVDLYAVTDL